MAAPANLGFETAGSSAEEAASWTVTIVSSQITLANFGGAGDPIEFDGFETGWGASPLLLVLDPLALTAGPVEGFETGWGLWLASFVLATSGGVEGFETGWGASPLLLVLDPLALTAGPVEGFETGWGAWSSTLTSSTAAPVEPFAVLLRTNAYVVAVGSPGIFTAVGHGYSGGSKVMVSVSFGGVLGGGLIAGRSYTVVAIDADTFTLLDVATPVVITSVGTGVQSVFGDPAFCWQDPG